MRLCGQRKKLTGLAAKAHESDIEEVRREIEEIRSRLRAADADPPETDVERASSEQAANAQNGAGSSGAIRTSETQSPLSWDLFESSTTPPSSQGRKEQRGNGLRFWAGELGRSLQRYIGGGAESDTAPGMRKPLGATGLWRSGLVRGR